MVQEKTEAKKNITKRSYNFPPHVANVIDEVAQTFNLAKLSFVSEAILTHASSKYGVTSKGYKKSPMEEKVDLLFSHFFTESKVRELYSDFVHENKHINALRGVISALEKNEYSLDGLDISVALGNKYSKAQEYFTEAELYIIALAVKYGIHEETTKTKGKTSSKLLLELMYT